MTGEDFRRLALSMPGAEQGQHMGQDDFRVGGRIFATLASLDKGFGNVMLAPAQQAAFVEERPDVFIPVAGKWGEGGVTHVRLAIVDEAMLRGVVETAWRHRVEKNGSPARPRRRARR